jgi:putative ABC transport system permease protein
MHIFGQIYESLLFAFRALKANILRTILSLLSVTVGIFLIIAVLTWVDSLESNIKQSFSFVGSNQLYVEKWPWLADNDGEYRWWDFWMRPTPSYAEFRFLEENLRNKSNIAISADRSDMVIKRNSSSIGQVFLVGGSEGYQDIFTIELMKGRYLSPDELLAGRNVAVVGHDVANALFPNNEDPLNQVIRVKNLKYTVIGVIKKEGENLLGTPSKDFMVIIPYNAFRKLYQTGSGRWDELQSSIAVKGNPSDVGLVELENEVRGMMRGRRGLGPDNKDNFAINRPEALMNAIGSMFDYLTIGGWIIGGMAMVVGGFGIMNIMFVSVKERTPIIGLQKSLGAKNYFILFQFLFESVFLCMIGGLTGLFLVFLMTLIPMGTFDLALSVNNIVLGIVIASVIGVVSGIVPAARAARMDPVDALRST